MFDLAVDSNTWQFSSGSEIPRKMLVQYIAQRERLGQPGIHRLLAPYLDTTESQGAIRVNESCKMLDLKILLSHLTCCKR